MSLTWWRPFVFLGLSLLMAAFPWPKNLQCDILMYWRHKYISWMWQLKSNTCKHFRKIIIITQSCFLDNDKANSIQWFNKFLSLQFNSHPTYNLHYSIKNIKCPFPQSTVRQNPTTPQVYNWPGYNISEIREQPNCISQRRFSINVIVLFIFAHCKQTKFLASQRDVVIVGIYNAIVWIGQFTLVEGQ